LLHYTNFKRHDPKDVVKNQNRMVRYSKSYQHEQCPLDIIFKGVENVQDVIFRIEGIKYIKRKENVMACKNEISRKFYEGKHYRC